MAVNTVWTVRARRSGAAGWAARQESAPASAKTQVRVNSWLERTCGGAVVETAE